MCVYACVRSCADHECVTGVTIEALSPSKTKPPVDHDITRIKCDEAGYFDKDNVSTFVAGSTDLSENMNFPIFAYEGNKLACTADDLTRILHDGRWVRMDVQLVM